MTELVPEKTASAGNAQSSTFSRSVSALNILITVIPVLTAGLYLIGFTYHQGYLYGYGIEESLMPLPSDRVLLAGVFSLIIMGLPAGVYALAALLTLALLVIFAAILASTHRARRMGLWIKARARKWRKTPSSTSVADRALDKGAMWYAYATSGFFFLIGVGTIAALSAKSGREQALNEIAKYSAETPTVTVYSGQLTAPFQGRIVYCGERYCAFWSPTGAEILRHEDIKRIVPKLRSGTAATK